MAYDTSAQIAYYLIFNAIGKEKEKLNYNHTQMILHIVVTRLNMKMAYR